ncbi:hypothetical protein [Staphylospora marina]|uniref:hypothetical protein n=1 Tax=Staphylospora marina TaxID=2490858 RepID=UPI000F5C1CB6|nr:hypothetical protein [Staphylospora marina]
MKRAGYPEESTEYVIEKLRNLDDRLQPVLDRWLEGEDEPDVAVNGVTLAKVRKYMDREFLRAMIRLSRYAESEEFAARFLEDPDRFRMRRCDVSRLRFSWVEANQYRRGDDHGQRN